MPLLTQPLREAMAGAPVNEKSHFAPT
jgi:hypothetical protein